jgi:pimeloyl-ACP methyl ester carboxylesterase
MTRAVVLVPGGGGNSPFTTPDHHCATGLAAGGQLTALRAAILEAGFPAFTCPARVGGGIMDADPGWGGFADGPAPLPADGTIDSVAPVRESGERLARFIAYLAADAGVTEVDLVGYSLGGIIGRDAIGRLLQGGPSVRVRSLTSVATPWLGSFVLLLDPESLPLPRAIVEFVAPFLGQVDATVSSSPRDRTPRPPVWARGYDHVLDGLPLTRIAGTYFPESPIAEGSALDRLEANDGFCTRTSALALGADPVALPPATCFELPDLHSNFLSDLIEEPWERGINWDPSTLAIVVEALQRARSD